MALRQLFNSVSSNKTTAGSVYNSNTSHLLSSASVASLTSVVEGEGLLDSVAATHDRFIPDVDFSDPSNWCHFGSAEEYYKKAVERVYQDYPYDGSRREKLDWRLSSSFVDLYVFDHLYPKTTGYIIMSPSGYLRSWKTIGNGASYPYDHPDSVEYIHFYGGPNTASGGMISMKDSFSDSNIYNLSTNRNNNLRLNPVDGFTVEFWMKKNAFNESITRQEVVFDLWNNNDSGSQNPAPTNGRFRIDLNCALTASVPFLFTCLSGTAGISTQSFGTGLTAGTEFNATWRHYAFSCKNTGSNMVVKFYRNGVLYQQLVTGSSIGEISGSIRGQIGALINSVAYDTKKNLVNQGTTRGSGRLSASLDEVRFWKVARTDEQIGRYWFTHVDGGSNVEDANVNLGLYYKFNEGIASDATLDPVILDYSGRVSNGYWTGYSAANGRNTGSSIVSSSAATFEVLDPIMRYGNPLVSNLMMTLSASGSEYDDRNSAYLYNNFPSFMMEEDYNAGGNAKNLLQIVGSYFDQLYLQIEQLPKIHQARYVSSSSEPYPFARQLLEDAGLIAPDLFVDADIIEQIASRSETAEFESELQTTKNLIYQNIFNNLASLYKSKGSEKSIRNVLRCFGADDSIVRLNTYAANSVVDYSEDKFRTTSVRKRLVDFGGNGLYTGSVYQFPDATDSNSTSFINGTTGSSTAEEFYPWCVEANIIVPKQTSPDLHLDYNSGLYSSSIFGVHEANSADGNDYSWKDTDLPNFQVYLVRDKIGSPNAKFVLTCIGAGMLGTNFPPDLSTVYFEDVYDNTSWNLSVQLSSSQFPFTDPISAASNLFVKFSGYNAVGDRIQNSFVTSSGEITFGNEITANPKRLYCGAHYQNFTGSLLCGSDVRFASLRYWETLLSEEELQLHAKDVRSRGLVRPYDNAYILQQGAINCYIPRAKMLLLDWDFERVTGSDSAGCFTVLDNHSGSYANYGWMDVMMDRTHPGRGYNFHLNSTSSVDSDFSYSTRQTLPGQIAGTDMVKILTEEDEYSPRRAVPDGVFYAFEKSMYQSISEEMLNMFAGISSFNNLIGEPVNRYRQSYKGLDKLREIFFATVSNTPDIEKYIEFYKWFDDSMTMILLEFVPASADVARNVRTVIESHILERNKYRWKFNNVKNVAYDKTTGIRGINELLYDWKTGHHPISDSQAVNCSWWQQRAERDSGLLASGIAGADSSRKTILSASVSTLERNYTTPHRLKIARMNDLGQAIKQDFSNAEYVRVELLALNNGSETEGIRIEPANVKLRTNCSDD